MTDQPAPLTDDQAFAAEIVCVTEFAAAIPQQLRARALSAVGPALQARGDWLRLSSRKAVADAVLVELKRELAALAEYENTITWMTTCTSCARVLDSSIRETERAEKAEAALARVEALAARVAAGHPVQDNPANLAAAIRDAARTDGPLEKAGD
ncbi:hypothetical protein [Streptomyces prasinus]